MSNKIEFKGVDDIIKRFEDIDDAQRIYKALGKCCAIVERSAKEFAPKGSGDLRRSIQSKVEGDTGIVFTPIEYAPYVEYGTGLFAEDGNGRTWDLPWCYQDEKGEWHYSNGQPPMPFMRPALNVNRERILRLMQESLLKDD